MGNNVSELGRTIAQLRELGRLEKIDAARVQMVRTMARALDENPQNAALWRQYREALSDVLEADDDADSSLAAALAQIRGATEVGDSSTG